MRIPPLTRATVRPMASRSMRKARGWLDPSTSKEPSGARPRSGPETLRERGAQNKSGARPIWVVLLAAIVFYVVMLAAGPVSFVESLADLDLGGGITMTDTGQIKVKNPLPTGPPRIPAESEYEGITTP